MRKRVIIGLSVLLMSSVCSGMTVNSEVPTHVELSNTDINRLVCQHGSINDVFYSQEKGISVNVSESNAFVKFLIMNDGNGDNHVTLDSEFYVVCDGSIYTLIASPKNIPAQTVYLSAPEKGNIQKNVALYSALPIEEQAVDLIKRTLTDDIPDSFNIKKYPIEDSVPVIEIKGIPFAKAREVSIEGVGLRLTEYVGKARFAVDLNEVDFLDTSLGRHTLAITLDPVQIRPGMVVRAYIVERV